MVLPSSGPISFGDIAAEYGLVTSGGRSIKPYSNISINYNTTNISMSEFYNRDRDDLVGKTATDRSVTGTGADITQISGNKSATVRMVVGLSTADNGILVDLGGSGTGSVIYTWNGTLYASCGNGAAVGGTVELSWSIPATWSSTTSRVVVVGFSVLDSSLNTLFVDGILRDSANAPDSGNPSEIAGSNTSGTGQVFGTIAANNTTGNPAYEAGSTIGGTQIWLNKLPYIPVYGGDKIIYASGSLHNVFTTLGNSTFGLYDVGPITRPDVRYLVVAGGGGAGFSGSNDSAGGGGGGGILFDDTGVTLAAGTYTVTVGDGGAGSTSSGALGGNGGNSVFGTTATALGGGGGGTQKLTIGADGGSGGGGRSGGGTGSQGGDGGGGNNGNSGGGGGGGGTSGQNGGVANRRDGGNGGNGTTYAWGHLGATSTTYGGGGGGQGRNTAGSGGAGGGGAGGLAGPSPTGQDGSDIYGGGGGGEGANGGSGHVTLRVPWSFQT